MNRILVSITSLDEHVNAVAMNPDLYRPQACPHCEYSRLWNHGCYYRKADRSGLGQSLNPVPVLRYLCASCKKTCSRLPACIAPRRWYDWAMQQIVLMLMLTGCCVQGCADFSGRARSTVRRWSGWLTERGELFAFHLRSRFAELGRTPQGEAFWHHLLPDMGLMRVMSWLDRDLIVP
ncbi:MAG: hypothetical protein IPN53_04730 [Comamonadaceae bacterium]|nr:hypothetical protein [Comamonadaceae bacterium]